MGQTAVIKLQILCFWLLSPLVLLLELLNIFGGNRKPYAGSPQRAGQIYPLAPLMGHKIVEFRFLAFISLLLHLLNILGGNKKPYTWSLESWSDFLPPSMGQTRVINRKFCVFGFYLLNYCF